MHINYKQSWASFHIFNSHLHLCFCKQNVIYIFTIRSYVFFFLFFCLLLHGCFINERKSSFFCCYGTVFLVSLLTVISFYVVILKFHFYMVKVIFFFVFGVIKSMVGKAFPNTKLEKDIKTETGRYTLYVCTYTHIYSSHSKISTFLSLASSSFKWAVPCISFQGLFKALPQGRLRVSAQGHPFRCGSRRGVASRYSLGLPAQNSQPHHFPCSPGPSFSRSGGSPPLPCTCSPALSQAPNTAFSASSVAGSMLVLGAPRKSQKHVAEGVFQGYLRAR